MKKLSEVVQEKLIAHIKTGHIKLKPVGAAFRRVFRLECERQDYFMIGLTGMISSAIMSLSSFVLRSCSDAQDMVITGISNYEGEFFFHGRCLNIEKRVPSIEDAYVIESSHKYDLDVQQRIEESILPAFDAMQEKFGFYSDISVEQRMDLIEYYKQLVSWIVTDDPDPIVLIRKVNGGHMLFHYPELHTCLKSDYIRLLIFGNQDIEFSKRLLYIVRENIRRGLFSADEIAYLVRTGIYNHMLS